MLLLSQNHNPIYHYNNLKDKIGEIQNLPGNININKDQIINSLILRHSKLIKAYNDYIALENKKDFYKSKIDNIDYDIKQADKYPIKTNTIRVYYEKDIITGYKAISKHRAYKDLSDSKILDILFNKRLLSNSEHKKSIQALENRITHKDTITQLKGNLDNHSITLLDYRREINKLRIKIKPKIKALIQQYNTTTKGNKSRNTITALNRVKNANRPHTAIKFNNQLYSVLLKKNIPKMYINNDYIKAEFIIRLENNNSLIPPLSQH